MPGWRRYVGGAPGKIDLYVGKEVVRRGIPMEGATDGLIQLIKDVRRLYSSPNTPGWLVGATSHGLHAMCTAHPRGGVLVDKLVMGINAVMCHCCSMGAGRTRRRKRRTSRPSQRSAWRRGPSWCSE